MLFQDIANAFLAVRTSWAIPTVVTDSFATNARCSLTLLYQNNLNASDDANHGSAILLGPMSQSESKAACSAIGESLMLKAQLQNYSQDFHYSLSYLRYYGLAGASQEYTIDGGVVSLADEDVGLQFSSEKFDDERLPALCTQSSRQNGPDASASANGKNRVSVASGDNTYVGFWNQKSFRFQGIPYADTPSRFEYSRLYSKTGQTIDATSYGASCTQPGDSTSSEDCLFLNIQTPFIPKAGSDSPLKPVLFSIHGGGFTGGNIKSKSGRDGGNFASREDIVSVAITYRLSTLGFLAVPGTDIRGNYGIGDQVTALRWVKKNIAQFGGDPEKITIIGESAGAGSVRALLGSPPVIKEKLIAGAVAQANLGGGVSLGLKGNYGTTYSSYYTIQQSYDVAGQQIFQNASCTDGDLDKQVDCLKNVTAETLISLPTAARFVVQDGEYVNTEQLIVGRNNGSTAQVPIVFGVATNEGGSIGSTYPKTAATSLSDGIQKSLGISAKYAQDVIDSGLFPRYDSGNLTLDAFNVSQRVATDLTFRCVDEATTYAAAKSGAFPKAYFYEMQRTYGGYDPSNLGSNLTQGPISPSYPYGNPHEFYFKLHTSDLGVTYGNQLMLRDQTDLLAMQLISGYFAQFAKTGDPNPDAEYLRARGYADQLDAVNESGEWSPVEGGAGPVKALDYPSKTIGFLELEQCRWLNYSLSYYLDGGACTQLGGYTRAAQPTSEQLRQTILEKHSQSQHTQSPCLEIALTLRKLVLHLRANLESPRHLYSPQVLVKMRLINIDTLELESFESPPRYAILSHRWTEDEMKYENYNEPSERYGPGYDKIRDMCRFLVQLEDPSSPQVRAIERVGSSSAPKCKYVWIDTVCIDKRSSAELSEAINSMWSFYWNAAYCIAYLADVPDSSTTDWRGHFQKSSWFRRGWTLQELLAPRHVIFCDGLWQPFGSKRDDSAMRKELCEVSGIPARYFDNRFAIFEASVARRMSWASRRETTKIEDIAYCLFGLFGVNLPLLYGEGNRAFTRLQEEIIRQSDDESIMAWRAPKQTNVVWNPIKNSSILASHPSNFIDSGDIYRVPLVSRQPYRITNRGLEFNASLTQVQDDIYLLRLNCAEMKGVTTVSQAVSLFQSVVATGEGTQGSVLRGCSIPLQRRLDDTFSRSHINVWSDNPVASYKPFATRTMKQTTFFLRTSPGNPESWGFNQSPVAMEGTLVLKDNDVLWNRTFNGNWYDRFEGQEVEPGIFPFNGESENI